MSSNEMWRIKMNTNETGFAAISIALSLFFTCAPVAVLSELLLA